MTTLEIFKFIEKYGNGLSFSSIPKTLTRIEKLKKANQVLWIEEKEKPIGLVLYYKVNKPDDVIATDETPELPDNYDKGNLLFVETVVVKKGHRREKILAKLWEKREPEINLIFWVNKKNKWKISRRKNYAN